MNRFCHGVQLFLNKDVITVNLFRKAEAGNPAGVQHKTVAPDILSQQKEGNRAALFFQPFPEPQGQPDVLGGIFPQEKQTVQLCR